MKQCQKCYTPNNDTSQYCESCGAALIQGETRRPTMAYEETQQAHPEYTVPPIQYPIPEPGYASMPESPIYSQVYNPVPMSQAGQFIYPTQDPGTGKKSAMALFFGILLYLIGSATAAFGLASVFMPTHNDTIVGAAFIIACLLEILVLIFILLLYRRSLIRGWLRIILFVCLTILAAIGLVAVFATSSTHQSTTASEYVGLGVVCIIYGLAMEIIAIV